MEMKILNLLFAEIEQKYELNPEQIKIHKTLSNTSFQLAASSYQFENPWTGSSKTTLTLKFFCFQALLDLEKRLTLSLHIRNFLFSSSALSDVSQKDFTRHIKEDFSQQNWKSFRSLQIAKTKNLTHPGRPFTCWVLQWTDKQIAALRKNPQP